MLDELTQFWIHIFSTYGWVIILLLMERVWYIYQQPLLRSGTVSDVIHTFQPYVLERLLIPSFVLLMQSAPHQEPLFLQNSMINQPLWLDFMVLVIMGETIFYTVHYCTHKIPLLWEFHRVHHSSVILDSLSTSRFHLFDRALFNTPFAIGMIYIGVDAESVLLFHVFRGFMDRYIHSNLNGPRWVHKFMVSSPYFHRWHHANDPQARDKNFSGDFIFLDVLFGTAYDPEPKIKPLPKEFGEPNYSNNFFVHQIMPFFFLYKRLKLSKSYRWLSTHLSPFSKSSS